jgi:anti-sigma regulatory factor (Ser/Thr protein kinase)
VKYGVHGFTAFARGISARTGFVQFHGRGGVTLEVATSSALLLPYTASSVGVARRRLIGDLTEAGVYEGTACDAGLVLSELISNALRHATPLPGRTVKVSWMLRQDSVEVAVSDGGGQTVPMVNQPSNWSLGGRGLGIVDRISLRWGVRVGAGTDQDGRDSLDGLDGRDGHCDGTAGETTVWAELPVRYGSSAGLVIASSRDA